MIGTPLIVTVDGLLFFNRATALYVVLMVVITLAYFVLVNLHTPPPNRP
jgi:hypothetical protein